MYAQAIQIGTGYTDQGAWHRAIAIARWLHQNNLWDGNTRLIVNETYDVHYRLECRGQEPVRGIDYEMPDVLQDGGYMPDSPQGEIDIDAPKPLLADDSTYLSFDADFTRWALSSGYRRCGDTFIQAQRLPAGRIGGRCAIWFVAVYDGRHLADCDGPNVRAAYVAADRQMRAVRNFGSLDAMLIFRRKSIAASEARRRNTSGLHEDAEDISPLDWCAADEAHENPYSFIDLEEVIEAVL